MAAPLEVVGDLLASRTARYCKAAAWDHDTGLYFYALGEGSATSAPAALLNRTLPFRFHSAATARVWTQFFSRRILSNSSSRARQPGMTGRSPLLGCSEDIRGEGKA